MWNNNDSWKPWAQHDSQYRPVRPPLHRSAPYQATSNYFQPPVPMSSLAPYASSSAHYHPYGRPERAAPYPRPEFFNEAATSVTHHAPYQRNPPAHRPDYWTPRAHAPVVPMNPPHNELWKDFAAPPKPLEVQMFVKKSAKECSVRWQKPDLAPQYSKSHIIKVFENEKLMDTAELDRNTHEYIFKTKPGENYTCEYRIKDSRGINAAEGTIRFRATFSIDEMDQLFKKALDFVNATRPQMHMFRILYRCKPQCYWDDIQIRSENIMRKYIKDDNGQAANPTNGMIFGLFFSARLLPNGAMPTSSPFGNIRMSLSAEVLLDPNRVNMYFSDFYCNRLTHYITIVICVKGSKTDSFCMDKLVSLAPSNPFVRIVYGNRGLEFYVNRSVWVEFYFTENVPVSWGKFDRVLATGLGTSRLGGLPHNKNCTVCNLYPLGKKETTPTVPVKEDEEQYDDMIAQAHLDQMVTSMNETGLPKEDCEDIVFLVNDLVDQVAYDIDVNLTIQKDTAIFGNEPYPFGHALNMLEVEKESNHPKTKGIAARIRGLHDGVTKRLDRVQSAIVKKKDQCMKRIHGKK